MITGVGLGGGVDLHVGHAQLAEPIGKLGPGVAEPAAQPVDERAGRRIAVLLLAGNAFAVHDLPQRFGIGRATLYRKLKELGIADPRETFA